LPASRHKWNSRTFARKPSEPDTLLGLLIQQSVSPEVACRAAVLDSMHRPSSQQLEPQDAAYKTAQLVSSYLVHTLAVFDAMLGPPSLQLNPADVACKSAQVEQSDVTHKPAESETLRGFLNQQSKLRSTDHVVVIGNVSDQLEIWMGESQRTERFDITLRLWLLLHRRQGCVLACKFLFSRVPFISLPVSSPSFCSRVRGFSLPSSLPLSLPFSLSLSTTFYEGDP
jgi:hypothetical protein